jgi:hypothetical protein
MTEADIPFVVFALGAAYVAAFRLPGLWSGSATEQMTRQMDALMRWDPALGRALLRALTAACAMALAGSASYVLDRGAGLLPRDHPVTGALEAGSLALIGVALALTVAFLGVVLFNAPKALVPPSMRGDRGLLSRAHN